VKALVLSGGSGTRLRPITHTAAKQLVPIANRPILFWALDAIAEAGITEVGIVVGRTREEVIGAVGDGSRFEVKATYLDQPEPLGLAHAVAVAREWLGEDDFVMYLGDNVLLGGIDRFVEHFRRQGRTEDALVLLAKVADPSRFGVARFDAAGRLVGLVEKPTVPPSDLALVGVYFFSPRIHEAIATLRPSARGELEITDAVDALLAEGREVAWETVDGYWKDLGDPEALLEGNRFLLMATERDVRGEVRDAVIDGPVLVEEGALVERAVVRGPATIGAGAVVSDAYVGPFSAIGAGCSVRGTEIENSIVLAGAVVEGVGPLDGCIIGREARVVRRERLPRAASLVVGDHSRIELA